MAEAIHSKIIAKVAKQLLKPHGIERKGQSRTWYDDQGWFTSVIEFQPHKWKHGAFLNVGVNFHWYAKNYISFDIGYRETGFEEFETEAQFTNAIEQMVECALQKTLDYRLQLEDLGTALAIINNYYFTSDELWGNYHRAVISGLNGQASASRTYFQALLAVNHEVPWANELKSRSTELMPMLDHPDLFKARILEIIQATRVLKKLKEVELVW